MDTKKILIVEDDKDIAAMYKIKFELEGFIVKLAENGLDAVTEVTEFKPNVILLDIMMPSMDGFETLKVIRELAPSIRTKIIMFSNLNCKEDIDKCMLLGADDYLLKANTTPKDAVNKVKEFLEIKSNSAGGGSQISSDTKCPHCGKNISVVLK